MTVARIVTSIAAAVLGFLAIPSATGFAQSNNVAVVDIQAILRDSAAAKSVRSQLETMTKALAEEAQKVRKELRREEEDLAGKRAILSPERFNQLRRELASEAKNHQVAFNNRRREIDRNASAAMGKVQDVFQRISTQIAKERNLSMVFSKTGVVLFPKEMDITDEILKRMDQQLPRVAVAPPK